MKRLIAIALLLTIASISAQMTPEEVVQKQLETYNNRDINGFMALIADDITFHDFSDGSITMKGFNACREFYSKLFAASPKLHSTILKRTVFGNKVIDHESIKGRNGNDALIALVLIYEVENEKINKVTVLKNQE